jgi:hypothetical protein
MPTSSAAGPRLIAVAADRFGYSISTETRPAEVSETGRQVFSKDPHERGGHDGEFEIRARGGLELEGAGEVMSPYRWRSWNRRKDGGDARPGS